MYRVFVSHSRHDNAAARAVVHWLIENEPSLEGEVFLDIDPQTGIAPGVRWKSELARAVDSCEAVICLISRDWENSGECVAEYRLAESLHKRVFCARLDPAAQGDKVDEWQYCDLFPDGDGGVVTVACGEGEPVIFAADGLKLLLRGLRAAGIGAEYFPWPPEDDPDRAPYRGWQAMEDADAAVFFGRDPQILRGLDTLRGMRATGIEGMFVILGPSGVGKSSFLRAGLLPRLRRDRRNFLVADIVRPERAALTGVHGLAQAVCGLRSRAGPGAPALGDVKTACASSDLARLSGWLAEAQRAAGSDEAPPTVVIPVDQGEELFATDGGAEALACRTLLASLLGAKAREGVPVLVVMTIRADRYESLQNAPELLGVHTREFGDLKPMPITEYKEVITGPAARASASGLRLALDPALVDKLLADAVGGGDGLPLLALTLSRLYLDYGGTGRLTPAHYEAMGGMARIVQAEIDTLLSADPDERNRQLETLRSAFVPWLATIDPDTDAPSRRVARYEELPPASRPLIDAMVGRRLLVKDERNGQTVVEVALESLLRQWDALASWLRDQATGLKLADNLDHAVTDWEANARSAEWLIGGVRLATAERLAESPVFRDRIRPAAEFLTASRQREDAEAAAENQRRETELQNAKVRREEAEAHAAALHKRTRVLWTVLAATVAVALVAVVTGVAAVVANKEADRKRSEAEARTRDALAGRLTSQVQAMLAGSRPATELEVVDKALAAKRLSDKEGTGVLLSVLAKSPRLDTVTDAAGAQLSADGRRAVAYTNPGIALFDTADWKPIGDAFAPGRAFQGLSFDGRYLATIGQEDDIRVWDADTRGFIGQPMTSSEKFVAEMVVSSDGRRVAAVDGNDKLRMWDVGTGRQIGGPLGEHAGKVKALAFSRDGQRLASAGDDGTVQLWNAQDATPRGGPLRTGDDDPLSSVAFSPDGHTVAAGGLGVMLNNEAPLWIWNADTGAPVGKQAAGIFKSFVSLAFSSDGDRIATGGIDSTVRLWDARTGEQIGDPVALRAAVFNIAFEPGDDEVVSASPETVQVLGARTRAGLAVETAGSKAASGRYALVKTKDGPRIVAFDGNTMRWLDVDTGQQLGPTVVSDLLRDVDQIDFSDNQQWLAVLSGDNTMRVLDASNGKPSGQPIRLADTSVNTMEFSPDGQTIATGSEDNSARLWDWRHGQQVGAVMGGHQYGVKAIDFSPDGTRLYTRSVDSVRVWDTATQKQLGSVRTGAASTAMIVSPDGTRLAVADYNYIQEWDATASKTVGPMIAGRGHASQDLAYNSDGRYLASVGADDTVRFWDLASGNQIGDAVDTSGVGSGDDVRFSPDDRRVFITAGRNQVRDPAGGWSAVGGGVWQLPAPDAWADVLCAKLTANPTQDQWKAWITDDPTIGYRELCPNKAPRS